MSPSDPSPQTKSVETSASPTNPSKSLQRDVDAELADLFDEPSPTNTPSAEPVTKPAPPKVVPESPKKQVFTAKPRSILDALLANRARLSSGAAAIVQDIDTLTTKTVQGVQLGAPEKEDNGVAADEKECIKKLMAARRGGGGDASKPVSTNSFKVLAAAPTNAGEGVVLDYIDTQFCNMSLTQPVYTQLHLSALFSRTNRVDISAIPSVHMQLPSMRPYYIFACLVHKNSKKTATNGSMYAVWTLCNMPRGAIGGSKIPPSTVTFLLFDRAYNKYHTTCPGAVFALRNPQVKPPRDAEMQRSSGGRLSCCVSISKPDDLIMLGVCKDFRLCDEILRNGGICSQWYDANRMCKCVKHSILRQKQLTMGSRMDVNNAPRAGNVMECKPITAPVDVSNPRTGPQEAHVGVHVHLQKKRDGEILKRLTGSLKEKTARLGKRGTGGVTLAELRVSKERVHGRHALANRLKTQLQQDSSKAHQRPQRQRSVPVSQFSYENALSTIIRLGYELQQDGSLKPVPHDIIARGLKVITATTHNVANGRLLKRPRSGSSQSPTFQKKRKEDKLPAGAVKAKEDLASTDQGFVTRTVAADEEGEMYLSDESEDP